MVKEQVQEAKIEPVNFVPMEIPEEAQRKESVQSVVISEPILEEDNAPANQMYSGRSPEANVMFSMQTKSFLDQQKASNMLEQQRAESIQSLHLNADMSAVGAYPNIEQAYP